MKPATPRRRRAALLAVYLGVALAGYGGWVLQRSGSFYTSLKAQGRGWSGRVHRADPELGFASVPGSRGAHLFPIGPPIPMGFDAEGFRTPVGAAGAAHPPAVPAGSDGEAERALPLLLTLGCSFTYGDAVPAEDTWPERISVALPARVRNAGVCGYGLAQLLLQARRLVPRLQPDWLVVQYSPWLAERAASPFAAHYYARLPTPYVYETASGQLAIHPPAYQLEVLGLPAWRFRRTDSGLLDFVAFVRRVGAPLYLPQDFQLLRSRLRRGLGLLPAPADSLAKIEAFGYRELAEIARQHDARLAVVVLGRHQQPVAAPDAVRAQADLLVEAHAALLRPLPERSWAHYMARYGHWRGEPPRLVDEHPNRRAHGIIAREFVRAWRAHAKRPPTVR